MGDNLGEAQKFASWICDNLGPQTSLDFLRFHPDYRMMDFPPRPISIQEEHHLIGKEEGLDSVYVGNVPGHRLEHTYCPQCGQVIVRRFGIKILEWLMDDQNRCTTCRNQIKMTGRFRDTRDNGVFDRLAS